MRPLDGIKVIDFTQAHAGSLCTMYLADFGAEVIKIERPGSGDMCRNWPPFRDGASLYFSFLNRGKKSITVNASNPKGKELLLELVGDADVVCENFKAGNMDRLGLGYEQLRLANDRIVYASLSGYGANGPLKGLPAYDLMLQCQSGIAHLTGERSGIPIKAGQAIGDHLSGIYLANAICLALIARAATGQSQRVDISILDSIFSILGGAVLDYSGNGVHHKRNGNTSPWHAPCDVFQTVTGFAALDVTNELEWNGFCQTIGRQDLLADESLDNSEKRVRNYESGLKKIIGDYMATRSLDEVVEAFNRNSVPCSAVMDAGDLVDNPHHKVRNTFITVDGKATGSVTMPGISIKLGNAPGSVLSGAPALGEHNSEILQQYGYEEDEII
ncbi:MAG: CoA transferase [Spirochaetales bacterium]|nr:MAG: CoA transferase [Spirochaetales bacterium]